jgi:hypothetical protein
MRDRACDGHQREISCRRQSGCLSNAVYLCSCSVDGVSTKQVTGTLAETCHGGTALWTACGFP